MSKGAGRVSGLGDSDGLCVAAHSRATSAREKGPGCRPPSPLSSATRLRQSVGAGHARPATLPLPPLFFILCIVGRGLDRLTAHNERRQPAKLARSCGCLPCRGKHCSLPDFAPLNRGPTLTTPHLRGASRTPLPTPFAANLPPIRRAGCLHPAAAFRHHPFPGNLQPTPTVGGGVLDAPQPPVTPRPRATNTPPPTKGALSCDTSKNCSAC